MQHPIFSAPLSALLASAVLSVAATGAMAQTTPPMTNPTTVGVTPQEAAEAARKAVQRTDTGTVVRTDESAAEKARNAADAARTNVPATRSNTPSAANPPPMTTNTDATAPINTTSPTNTSPRGTTPVTATETPSSVSGNTSNMNGDATRNTQRRARADRN